MCLAFIILLHWLVYQYRQCGKIDLVFFTVQSISQVYTAEELKRLQMDKSYGGASFSGILFAFLTSFPIDEDPANVVCSRWYVNQDYAASFTGLSTVWRYQLWVIKDMYLVLMIVQADLHNP